MGYRGIAIARCILGTVVFAATVVACNSSSVRSEAQQIVQEQQHVAAVNTMTDLLLEQQAAESTATAAIVTSQETATVASVQIGETATASAAQVAVQETQAPIIAAATVAAAQDAAKVQATEIVDAAHRGETLATQATATAQADAAQAQANAEAQRSSYAAWQQRYNAAAHYVAYCPQASEVASDTTSISEAVATAQASDTGYHNCSVTEAPTPRLPLTSASQPTPAQPTPSASLQAAIARVDQEGYDVVDKRDYDDPFALHVLIGVKVPTADGYT
jgi:hypothetical protein